LHERLGRGRHVLLGFVADEAAVNTLLDMLRLLRSALGESAAGLAVALPSAMPGEREGLPLLTDRSASFVTAYFAQRGMAWLVRPDGYVGWCSDAPSVTGLHNALETISRMPPAPG
jgi:Aromatic-ring hydroxylase, C-terminal